MIDFRKLRDDAPTIAKEIWEDDATDHVAYPVWTDSILKEANKLEDLGLAHTRSNYLRRSGENNPF